MHSKNIFTRLIAVLFLITVILFSQFAHTVYATATVADIPELKVWLKANELGLSNGASVATWSNEGSDGDFTQSTTNYKPTFVTNQVNSLPVVRFDGSDDFMDGSVTTGGDVTVFAVAANKRSTIDGVDVLVSSANAGGGSGFTAITSNQWISNTQRQMLAEGSGISSILKKNNSTTPITLAKDEFALMEYEFSSVGSRSTMRLSKFTDDTFKGQHDIAELLVFNAKLSVSQKQIVIDYLKTKYGLSVTAHRTTQNLTTQGERLKGAMYWPKNATSPDWWPAYLRGTITDAEIAEDLHTMKTELGINMVRVFVFYDLEHRKSGQLDFTDGAGTKNDAMRAKLSTFIDLADAEGLDVVPSLFQEMETSDATQFGVGTTLVDHLTYHKEYAHWLADMFATKDNIPAVIIINEPDGFGAWGDSSRAVNILTWLREIKTELNSVLPDTPIWINTSTHDNVPRTFGGAPSGSRSIYEISDAYVFNSFLWADNGYWEYSVPPLIFNYVLSNNTSNKPVILMEFGHPSHNDDDGVVIADGFWDKPVGHHPTTPSTELMQKRAIAEFSYWAEQKYIDGVSVWSGLDHPENVYRDPFGLVDIDGTGKLAAAMFKRIFTNKFDANGEAPLSLMQGTSTGTAKINGIEGTSNLPGGVTLPAGESYASDALPYKIPVGIKLTLQQSSRPTSGGPKVGINLKAAGVNKILDVRREESTKRWRFYIDGTEVASTVENTDSGLSTSAFTLEFRFTESKNISVLLDGTALTLYTVSGGTITNTPYSYTVSDAELASDLVLQVAASSTTQTDVISAFATGSAGYPIVTQYDNTMADKKKTLSNILSGFSVVKTGDWSTDVTSSAQWGTQTVGLVEQSSGKKVAEFPVDFSSNRDWSGLFTASGEKSAVVHYAGGIANLPGISGSTFSLYIPKAAGDTAVYICPDASTLTDVTTSCTNGYRLTTASSNVSVVTIDGQTYWNVDELSGTGGISYVAATPTPIPTAVPSITTNSESHTTSSTLSGECTDLKPGRPPELYAAKMLNKSSIQLFFTDGSDPYNSYHLRFRRSDRDWEFGQLNFAQKGDRIKAVNYLIPGNTYVFQIQAVHGCATSDWSNEFTVKFTSKAQKFVSSPTSRISTQKSTQAAATTTRNLLQKTMDAVPISPNPTMKPSEIFATPTASTVPSTTGDGNSQQVRSSKSFWEKLLFWK